VASFFGQLHFFVQCGEKTSLAKRFVEHIGGMSLLSSKGKMPM